MGLREGSRGGGAEGEDKEVKGMGDDGEDKGVNGGGGVEGENKGVKVRLREKIKRLREGG